MNVIIFSKAQKLKQQISAQLNSITPSQIQQTKASILQLRSLISQLETAAKQEVTALKREQLQSKCANLKQDLHELNQALTIYIDEQQRLHNENMRNQLLGGNNELMNRNVKGSETVLSMGDTPNNNANGQNLNHAGSEMERMLQMGRGALSSLYEQREIIKVIGY